MKKGVLTTEFWMTVGANVVNLLLQFGVFPNESPLGKALVFVATIFATLGYGVSRSMVKKSGMETGTPPALPKKDKEETKKLPGIPAVSVTGIVLCIAAAATLVGTMSGCCTLHGNCQKGTVAFCASKEVQEQAPHLLPVLADLVMHGVADLDNELTQLAVVLGADGLDIIKCIMGDIATQQTKLTLAPGGAPPDVQRGQQRASDWLKRHGK